jgi:endonuclease/exonuclease/phosphatase family metal-dependent hydrolase
LFRVTHPHPRLLLTLLLAACVDAAPGDPVDPGGEPGKADDLGHGGEPGAEDLDVWSWNLENFPHADGAPEAVAAILEERGADIVGLQEIDETGGLDATLDALGGSSDWGGFPGQPGFATQVAIAYRRDKVRVVAIEDLFVDDSFAFPRPPLAVTFEIRGRPELGELTVVVVHLKAQIDAASEQRRRVAVEILEAWIYQRRLDGRAAVLAVGDWNDELGDDRGDNVFLPFLDRPENYRPLTVELDAAGAFSYIPFRRLIDHAVATREAAETFPPLSVDVLELDAEIEGYVDDLSDHRPVRSVLGLPAGS